MTNNSLPPHRWYQSVLLGMVRAGEMAIEVAEQTNTKLAIWVDGKTEKMTPKEWAAYRQKRRQNETSKHV